MESGGVYDINISTIMDSVLSGVRNYPDKHAFTFLQFGKDENKVLTYEELHKRALSIASFLSLKVRSEKQIKIALLVYPQGLDFVEAFIGCLYAGIVVIPIAYEHSSRFVNEGDFFTAVAKSSGADIVLTLGSLKDQIESKDVKLLADFKVLLTDQEHIITGDSINIPVVNPDSVALIQYTSGSTGNPKGIAITHQNLIENCSLYRHRASINQNDVIVSWMPHFHNTCLIMAILQSIYSGAHCVLLSPVDVIQNPLRWLRAISDFRGSITLGPNFAYNLCIDKIEDISDIDLSSLEVAINGSESVHAKTMENFAKKFSSCGFKYNAFTPGWGLSEATVLVTAGERMKEPLVRYVDSQKIQEKKVRFVSEEDKNGQEVVSCGNKLPRQEILIVNPDTLKECAADEVGEIWLQSNKCKPKGYWNDSEKTQEVFECYLSEGEKGPFLRTGDLGFYIDNNLFIYGRLKEMLLIRGKNYYSQDIEKTVGNSDCRLNKSRCMAFSSSVDEEECLILVCELGEGIEENETAEIFEKIRSDVALKFGLSVYNLVFLSYGSMPKTNNGKLSRHLIKNFFHNKKLDNIVSTYGFNV